MLYNPRPAPGVWRDSLCDCGRNLFPSCWCSFCCCHGAWQLGMISERAGSCRLSVVVISYTVFMVLMTIITIASHGTAIGLTAVLLPYIFIGLFAAWIRVHVVGHLGIRAWSSSQTCNNITEGCVGCVCTPCSIAQMARHIYGYNKPFDSDSDPHRADMYDPLPENRPLSVV